MKRTGAWKLLRDPQRRAVYAARLRKRVMGVLRPRASKSTPLFVLGLQRSGTNMLMDVLHLRDDTQVFSESRENPAFSRWLLKDLGVIDRLIADSWAPFVCFKPISDSHRVGELLDRYPDGRFVWLYRRYQDVANSTLRAFPHPTRAIKRVCRGEGGGGWFDEGVSPAVRQVLRQVDVDRLSDFDLACLIWWSRNAIYLENQLWRRPNVVTVNYERLASQPREGFGKLFGLLGMAPSERSLRHVRSTSIRRHEWPDLDPEVEERCRRMLQELDVHAL